MYAVIECGGKQYRVQEGDLVRVEKLPVVVGSNVTIDRVLLIGGEQTLVGNPLVEGARIVATVLNQDKEKKVLVFHYKAKKNIRVRYGHRQPYTSLMIEKILKAGESDERAGQPVTSKKSVKIAKVEQAAAKEAVAPAKPKAAKAATAQPKTEQTAAVKAVKAPKAPKVEATSEEKPKTTRTKKVTKTEA